MQPLNSQQVQAYLQHLGTHAPLMADRENLDRLIAAQLQRVPFENIDVLLQRPILLDADAVFAKVVERGRGGYCFEINSLFARLLLSFGYSVSLLGARVRWGLASDAGKTMLSHLLLRVELSQGSFIVDIGFGGPTPPCAMPLEGRGGLTDCPYQLLEPNQASRPLKNVGEEVETRQKQAKKRSLPAVNEHFEPVFNAVSATQVVFQRPASALYQLQALQNGRWQTMYQFDLQPQAWVDHIARSWYTSTHPESIFLSTLMCARSSGELRLSLGNRNFSRRDPDGRVEQQTIESAAQLVELLRHEFGLNLDPASDGEPLRQRLQTLLQF